MRGRKPKPTALRKLHRSDQPLNPNEPKPEGDLAARTRSVPAHFDDDQRDAWNYALANSPPGLLKAIDAGVLECWVVAHCFHRQATKALMSESSLLVPAAPGSTQMVQSAYLQIVNRQAMIMMRAASELGFSPTARPRIGLTLGGGELNGPQDVPAGQESLDAYLQRAPKATAVH
ncbi:MAG TPA: P27 family phage terminase small subunit [Acetobacteraceae bacterium]|jgi:phage terminase small subunit|nr:P27 family phage terminase small subunit [Acetobacteraceae bacterium]